MSSVYERELRAFLAGERASIESFSKTCTAEQRANLLKAVERPFLVVRAAGSLGADLVAVRENLSFLVEVKSSKQKLLHFTDSPRLLEQLDEIRGQCSRAGVLPVYAYRLKSVRGDGWRVFTLDGMALNGRAGIVYQRLPKLERTAKGNPVMRWENGWELNKFMDYVTSL